MSQLGPICLILTVGGTDADVVIKGVIKNLPPTKSFPDINNTNFYEWQINNKYYTALIHFCKILDKNVLTQNELRNKIEAVIIYFNSQQSLEAVNDWIPSVNTIGAEVKILVCEKCSVVEDENSVFIKKINALQWCIKHGFELVELDPSEKPDPEDDFPETLGIERITQALNAHSWSNLELKSESEKNRIDYLNRLLVGENDEEGASLEDDNNLSKALEVFPTGERLINEGVDSFEELFQSMSMMKSQAEALQGADRKAYAEKVTMAFWRAIDGDVGEIEGLDSSDEDGNNDSFT